MNKTEILNIVNEPSKIDYRRAFKIACDLLNGDVLYGVDTDKIYELMMQKDDVVSSSSYEEYILNHLQDLDQGQYASEPTTKNNLAHNLCDSCANIGCEFQSGIVRTKCAFYMPPQLEPDNCGNYVVQAPTTKNNLGVDCVSRQEVDRLACRYLKEPTDNHVAFYEDFLDLNSVTPQEPRWIPINERLPDEGYSVLVMRITDDNYKYMRVATYQGDCWMDDTDKFNKPNPHKVIAWMPLPKPYEPQESEDNNGRIS